MRSGAARRPEPTGSPGEPVCAAPVSRLADAPLFDSDRPDSTLPDSGSSIPGAADSGRTVSEPLESALVSPVSAGPVPDGPVPTPEAGECDARTAGSQRRGKPGLPAEPAPPITCDAGGPWLKAQGPATYSRCTAMTGRPSGLSDHPARHRATRTPGCGSPTPGATEAVVRARLSFCAAHRLHVDLLRVASASCRS